MSNINGKTIAEWWDEDVESMFEDGFFVSGRGKDALARSVLEYLTEMGKIKAKRYTYDVV